MSASVLRRLWHGFTRLFGLDACAVTPPPRREARRQRQLRERLQARLGGRTAPASPPGGPPPAHAV